LDEAHFLAGQTCCFVPLLGQLTYLLYSPGYSKGLHGLKIDFCFVCYLNFVNDQHHFNNHLYWKDLYSFYSMLSKWLNFCFSAKMSLFLVFNRIYLVLFLFLLFNYLLG
jgi:hypothetical protein